MTAKPSPAPAPSSAPAIDLGQQPPAHDEADDLLQLVGFGNAALDRWHRRAQIANPKSTVDATSLVLSVQLGQLGLNADTSASAGRIADALERIAETLRPLAALAAAEERPAPADPLAVETWRTMGPQGETLEEVLRGYEHRCRVQGDDNARMREALVAIAEMGTHGNESQRPSAAIAARALGHALPTEPAPASE